MEASPVLKLENQLCFAVYACAREITKMYHPLLKELGLTYTQYVTMLALWENDRVTVKHLGSRLYLDSGTLTPLLKKLEAMGLLVRARDPGDERSVVISLTEQGAALQEKALEIPTKLFCQAGVTAQEADRVRREVTEILNKFHSYAIEEETTDVDL